MADNYPTRLRTLINWLTDDDIFVVDNNLSLIEKSLSKPEYLGELSECSDLVKDLFSALVRVSTRTFDAYNRRPLASLVLTIETAFRILVAVFSRVHAPRTVLNLVVSERFLSCIVR